MMKRAERRHGRVPRGQRLPCMEPPVLRRVREEIADLEGADVAAPVVADHEPKLGPAVGPQRACERDRAARQDGAVDGPAADPRLGQARPYGGDDRPEILHRPAISTTRSRSAVTGAGITSPRTRSAATHTAIGTTPSPARSPRGTSAGVAP